MNDEMRSSGQVQRVVNGVHQLKMFALTLAGK